MTCGRPPPRLRRDHPREYGENAGTVDGCGCGIGSSPRIRGKFVVDAGMGKGGGIIPANTGKIPLPLRALEPPPDHPREYGENWDKLRGEVLPLGSSPRIRGKYSACRTGYHACGIIPANTGKILRIGGCCAGNTDHPREYGENTCCATVVPSEGGSSPRIRGKSLLT